VGREKEGSGVGDEHNQSTIEVHIYTHIDDRTMKPTEYCLKRRGER
jgi:hypothetical protein